jgi:energy-coupling factor transport system permease protein
MDHGFSRIHPMVSFLYYVVMMVLSMMLFHPICLLLIFSGGVAHSLVTVGMRDWHKWWKLFLYLGVFTTLLNPFINNNGETLLFNTPWLSVTLEALVYGGIMSLSLWSILVLFLQYQYVIHAQKFMFVLGNIFPKWAFLMTLSIRFVQKLRVRFQQMVLIQQTRGIHSQKGSVMKRMKAAMHLLNVLVLSGLEEAFDTADSMKARYFGQEKRTSHLEYRMKTKDYFVLVGLLLLSIGVVIGWYKGQAQFHVYPVIQSINFSMKGIELIISCFILSFMPFGFELKEKYDEIY